MTLSFIDQTAVSIDQMWFPPKIVEKNTPVVCVNEAVKYKERTALQQTARMNGDL